MNNLKEAIRLLAQGERQTVSLVCKVDAVDIATRTVDCTPLDESAPLLGVNLQANQGSDYGIVVFPKVGSFVVVGFVSDGNAAVVLLTDEIESVEIVFKDAVKIAADKDGIQLQISGTSAKLTKEGISLNGDSCGGMVKVAELTKKINGIEQDINNLKSLFAGWTPVVQDGGAALKTAVCTSWANTMLSLTQTNELENEKVKHG